MKRTIFPACLMAVCVMLAGIVLVAAPARGQDDTFCNVEQCPNVLCLGLGYDPNFEDDLRSLYTTLSEIPIIGGLIAVETADLDFNGMPDIAQARLFDGILSNRLAPNHCCVYTPYMTNLIAAEVIAVAIVAAWPEDIYGIPMPDAPDSGLMARVIAALATSGQEELINTLLQTLASFIPNLPDIDYGVFDGSAEPYLAKNGDADTDGVCNVGEYQAWVVTAPDDYDSFVTAAMNNSITDYYGGCPDCSEGTSEGTTEGASEGSSEGQTEGETPCDIDSAVNYYKVMILFGDTDHDLLLSKAEFQTIAPFISIGWFLIDSNHDNYLSQAEFTGNSLLLSLMPDIDPNEDNLFTLDELHRLSSDITQEQFTAMDYNQDGYIDCDELNGTDPGPAGSCYAEGCHLPCQASAIQSGYETALRNLYTMAIIGPLIGGDPDTTDKDGNGIIDVAQARLFDAVLGNPDLNPFCCVRDVYMSNRAAAQALLDSIPLIGSLLPDGTFVPLVAAITTQGEQSTIDSILGLFDAIPFFPAIDLSSFDFSAAQYLASNGDPDYDWVCTLGEYTAIVSSAADFDAFVAAALDDAQTADGGNCPACPEGETEGIAEGATEGQVEGDAEGQVEGAAEGQTEGEGQIECEIAATESYYHLLIALGDLDGDGTLSKDELVALTGWNQTVVNIGWALIDSDGNGELSLSEFMSGDWLLNLLPSLDSNGDNQLTLSEIQTLSGSITQGAFDGADINDNGVIDCVDLYGTVEGEEEGQAEGVLEGAVEGQGEGETEGVVEGGSEGAEEGQEEGQPEGAVEGEAEGQPEGEGCVLDTCPDFDAEGTAFYAQLSALISVEIDWTSSDIDASSIPDSWEVALFQAVVCNTG
nr:hypothetical protein [Candidatus Hydrogenedentota bacterium]